MSRSLIIAVTVALTSLPGICGAASMAKVRHLPHLTYMRGNGGHHRHVFYGVGNGGETPRTTMTGGNAGGYSNRE